MEDVKLDRNNRVVVARKERQRTIQDRLISGFNSCYYALTEPAKLRILRLMHGADYGQSRREKKPLVSVYVPTYNRAELLMERAVSSVLNQSYRNIELVIVGDCCTDNTEELVSRIKDKRVRFFNLPKKGAGYPLDAEGRWFAGPVAAANKALRLVKGKWIARIDDDDTWTADHVEVLLRFAQKENYEFVSATHIEKRFGKRQKVKPYDLGQKVGGTQTWLYRAYLKQFKYNPNCWRKGWNRVNDADFQDRLNKAGVRMGYLDRVVAYVLPRHGEKTVGFDAYKIAEKTGFKKYYGKR